MSRLAVPTRWRLPDRPARDVGLRVLGCWSLSVSLLAAYFVVAEEVVADGRSGLDLAVESTVHGWTRPALTTVLETLTRLGSTQVATLVYAALAVALLSGRRIRAAAGLVAVAAGGHMIVDVLKALSERGRPGVFASLTHTDGYSFPSGHTFAAALAYGLLASLAMSRLSGRRRALPWVGWGVVVGVVGFSRIYLGAHYLTDVLASVLLAGALLTVWVTVGGVSRDPRRMRPGPPMRYVPYGGRFRSDGRPDR